MSIIDGFELDELYDIKNAARALVDKLILTNKATGWSFEAELTKLRRLLDQADKRKQR